MNGLDPNVNVEGLLGARNRAAEAAQIIPGGAAAAPTSDPPAAAPAAPQGRTRPKWDETNPRETYHLPAALIAEVKAAAIERGISKSALARELIEDGLRRARRRSGGAER